jgi:hypothetical protein
MAHPVNQYGKESESEVCRELLQIEIIPIDSGLIFSFASSVLVSGREQMLL